MKEMRPKDARRSVRKRRLGNAPVGMVGGGGEKGLGGWS